MTEVRRKLTYANVMSTLAVFLLIGGGGAYAASQLGKSSVGAKQLRKNSVTTSKIKKNAVTSAKVKAHTLTGSDINLKKLGTVPNATHASSADSIPQAEATHVIGASGEPAFENGATNSAAMLSTLTLPRAGFYKDAFGVVHLEGVVKAGGIPIIFTLPAGYRPAGGTAQIFEQSKEAPVIILGSAVTGAGAGAVIAGAENVILDGITYRAGG